MNGRLGVEWGVKGGGIEGEKWGRGFSARISITIDPANFVRHHLSFDLAWLFQCYKPPLTSLSFRDL